MRGPARSPLDRQPAFRTLVAASFLIHAALFLVPSAIWQQAAGRGIPRPGEGKGALVISFYDPGPPEESSSSRLPGPELPPPPEPAPAAVPEVSPARAEVPVEPSPPEPETAATPGPVGEGGSSPPGVTSPGTPAAGESPGSTEEGENLFQPPRLLTGALPLDPDEIEDLEVPREIPVRILVGRTGRVLRIEPLEPGLPEVVENAIARSARAMRFVPARRGDEAMEAWFSMTFVYDPGS